MARAKRREPRRRVTRTRPTLTPASSNAPSTVGPGADGAIDSEDSLGAAEELLDSGTRSLLAALAKARNPLAAEVTLCTALGAARSGLPDDVDEEDRHSALTEVLGGMIDHAERLRSVEALALLRVCSVLGPASTRSAAHQGASRLATAGVPDRPWAATVGSPALLRAWRYGDNLGAQSSIGLLFDYRGREHAVTILIDHLLGGGVKDCWLAEGRAGRTLRDRVAGEVANNPTTYFEDIGAAEVVPLLDAALATPPCPEQADQIEDVDAYLDLLQARVEHVARVAGVQHEG